MKVLFTNKSKKQLLKIDLRFQEKITNSLEKFERGESVDIKKLKGKKDEYRIRVGHYRIILNKLPVEKYLVTKIGERESIYMIFF